MDLIPPFSQGEFSFKVQLPEGSLEPVPGGLDNRTAALLGKAVSGDASALPAHTVLRMATLNGAAALGIAGETGSLTTGKWADITAVRMDSLEAQPVYDPVSHLVYACGREQVSDVWVAGQHLLKERRLTTLDDHEILNRVRLWQERIGAANRTGHAQP